MFYQEKILKASILKKKKKRRKIENTEAVDKNTQTKRAT